VSNGRVTDKSNCVTRNTTQSSSDKYELHLFWDGVQNSEISYICVLFPNMPTAIVTGATGILGREIVAALANDPSWDKVHALSRSQKEEYPDKVQHDHIDLLASPNEIAKQLKDQGVTGEYLFFAAYMAKSDEKAASDVNGRLSAPEASIKTYR
jgi:hypothetical protein